MNKCKTILTVNDYKKFKEKTKGDFSILENIFSLKNQKINGIKFKVIKILGIPLKFNFNKTLGDI